MAKFIGVEYEPAGDVVLLNTDNIAGCLPARDAKNSLVFLRQQIGSFSYFEVRRALHELQALINEGA